MRKYIKNRTKAFYSTLFILLTTLIFLSGVAFYEFRTIHIKQEKYRELSAIADLKVSQIHYWREDKIGDAQVIANDPFFIATVDFYLRTRNKADLQEIHSWMNKLVQYKGYSSICIMDKNFKVKLGDTSMVTPGPDYLRSIINNKESYVSELYMLPDRNVVMDIYIPLIYHQGKIGKDVGIVILRIDPQHYLDKVIASWPSSSETSEIIIWRKSCEDSAVFITRPRHSEMSPLSKKYSIHDNLMPVSKAYKGTRGIVEGKDYRGEAVLADIREVPNTDWIVVTKTDLTEVYAPLKELTYIVLLIGFILTGATASIIGSLWRNQRARFYKKLLESELDKKALLKNFEFLTKYANDIILLTDKKGNITYSNEKASHIYGHSADEMKKLNIKILHSGKSEEEVQRIFHAASERGGLLYEAVHLKKDGTSFPVESSSRFIEVEGNVFFQSIIRDVSEKKKADEQLHKTLKEKEVLLKEVHHRVKNNLQTINSLLNLQASTIEDERLRRFFLDAQNRIKSMALIHQELYSFNLSSINSKKYIKELVSHLTSSFDTAGRIQITEEVDDKLIGIDLAIPLGLIITEILTNTFKHAFPDQRKGNINIQFKDAGEGSLLRIKDDGIGIPDHLDIYNLASLGMQLIFTLIDQIDGTVEIQNKKGTEFIIRFNEPALVTL